MVREIVHLQVGQCGNQVGSAIWDLLYKEHGLKIDGTFDLDKYGKDDEDNDGTPDKLEKVNVYFNRTAGKNSSAKADTYVPRALIVDLEPGTIDVIKASEIGPNFVNDNLLFGANGAGNNWAKGHYTEGAELVEDVLDKTQAEIEKCDCPQGFQIVHSLGGGTGSGMGTLLLLKIRDQYPDRITTTYSVYPSPKVSDTVVEPYNAVLSSHQLLENSDETFIIDNEALYNIANNVLKIGQPKYSELNVLVAQVSCGITSSLRFPGTLNGDLRKLGVNLVPFPRLHFFLVSQAPLYSKENQSKTKTRVKELCTQAFSPRNYFSNVKPDDGLTLACSMTFRGSMSANEVDEGANELQKTNLENFVEWIPNNIKTSIITEPSIQYDWSCTFVSNTTALKGIYQRLATQFGAMYKRKAFLHWYKGEGMDEMEFQEADKNVRDLITEYQDKQEATYEAEDDEEEEEDDI